MKVVGAHLSSYRISAFIIEPRLDTTLHQLHHNLVLSLDSIEFGTCTLASAIFTPDIRNEGHFHEIRTERSHDVDRATPRVEVEHHVRKEPVVVGADSLAEVGRAF